MCRNKDGPYGTAALAIWILPGEIWGELVQGSECCGIIILWSERKEKSEILTTDEYGISEYTIKQLIYCSFLVAIEGWAGKTRRKRYE